MDSWRSNRGSQSFSNRGSSHKMPRRPYPSFSLPSDRDILEGLHDTPLATLEKPSQDSRGKAITIENQEWIGSYNWVSAPDGQPTIIVPGSPREWQGRELPFSVSRDMGSQYVDQHSHRIPSFPLLPLFRAVYFVTETITGEPVDWGSVDLVTDRNSLRKLLSWIEDERGVAKDFRIDVEFVGKRTILFSRWEKRTREDAHEIGWRSYGFNFLFENTTAAPGCEGGTGHHRITKYDFDGLSIVLRFAVDACLPQPRNPADVKGPEEVNHISDLLSALNVASTSQSIQSTVNANDVRIQRGGLQVPQNALIELATRSETYLDQFDWGDAYPQLFLSQTPNHYLAEHNKGTFTCIVKRNLDDPELKEIDADAQVRFGRLRRALQQVGDLVKEHGQRGRLSLVCQKGVMQVYQRTSDTSCLPDDVVRRFE